MLGGFASTCFSFGGGGGTWVAWGVVSGTLLGPEGSGVLLPRFFSAGLVCRSYRFVFLTLVLGLWLAPVSGGVPPVF